MADTGQHEAAAYNSRSIVVDRELISSDALLRTCYWFSRDFLCEVTPSHGSQSLVTITPKSHSATLLEDVCRDFLATAMDFSLRERVMAQTSGIRDLILAKAFSESGVLEDEPIGVFGDRIEEGKEDGMFKILSNG